MFLFQSITFFIMPIPTQAKEGKVIIWLDMHIQFHENSSMEIWGYYNTSFTVDFL